MNLEIIFANYQSPKHAQHIVELLNAYSEDPMGGGKPLPEEVKQNLVAGLAARDYAHTVIAYLDNEPAGLINVFDAFSSFKAKPLMNIHDVVVLAKFRGLGLSQKMLNKVEELAKEKGCCKLTLEVLSGNAVAKSAYEKFGFTGYELDPKAGQALFWEKEL